MTRSLSVFLLAALVARAPFILETQAETPPPPARGSLLFLSLSPKMDAAYGSNLQERGWAAASVDLKLKLTPEFLKRFDVIVIDQTLQAGNEWEVFGQKTHTFRENLALVEEAVRDGAGLLIYPNLNDCGGSLSIGFNRDMKPFGLAIRQAAVIDFDRSVYGWNAYGTNAYVWTEALADHPATKGLKRIYYPSGNARWDDCYLAPPLVADSNWTVLVRGMPGSLAAVSTDSKWSPMEGAEGDGAPALAAVRSVGRGRMAALSIAPAYIHRFGLSRLDKLSVGEQSVGIMDGLILEKGEGTVPSDTGRFVLNLYGWLGEGSRAAGRGGFRDGDPVTLAEPMAMTNYNPVLDLENGSLPPSWKHRATRVWRGSGEADYPELADPFVPGEIRFFKGLIGPRTALSDGRGTVADYAAAARKAGYAMLVFTETFEALTAAEYAVLVAECERNTADDLVCLPGFDIQDPWGNHFLVLGAPFYPRKQWLTPDGKRLAHPPYINLCYGDHMVVAHRTTQGTVPNERLKHWQGFTVHTYKGGKPVEDASSNYAWQAESASVPHPLAVHELYGPEEVAAAARAGYQQILPSDTPAGAASYFRVGLAHYFDGPSRHLLSEGPVATVWTGIPKDAGPSSENRDMLRVDITVTNDRPLAVVELKDGFRTVRRWLPGTNVFSARAFFRHDRQRALFLTAKDEDGRGLLTSVLRTVPSRYHFRCSDRQNWLGHVAAWYTGQHLPFELNVSLPVQGTEEGSGLFVNTRGACMAAKLNYPFTSPDVAVIRTVLDERYTEALRQDVSADARPSHPSVPSTVYAGTVTTYTFTGKRMPQCPVLVDFDLTLRSNVTAAAASGLFPSFGGLRSKNRIWRQPDGSLFMETNAMKGSVSFDVPAFGLAGGYVPLEPGFRVANGQFGLALASSNQSFAAGTRLRGRFLISGPGAGLTGKFRQSAFADEGLWLEQLGFAGKAPYELKLDRGSVKTPSFPLAASTEEGLLRGRVTKPCTNMLFHVPLELAVNPNLPAGIWQEGDERVTFAGVFEGKAWPRLDVGRKGAFVAGQLVTASDPDVMVDVVAWTKRRVALDVHNPTDRLMEVALRAAPVPGLKALKKTVKLPPGTSQLVTAE